MTKPIVAFALSIAAAVSFALPVEAGIPELPEEELFEQSTLVADIEVVSTQCDGYAETTPIEGEDCIDGVTAQPLEDCERSVTRYASQFKIREVLKGDASVGDIIDYRIEEVVYTPAALEAGCADPQIVLPQALPEYWHWVVESTKKAEHLFRNAGGVPGLWRG